MQSQEKIEIIAVQQLVPYAQNSRTHSKQQVEQLAKSIQEFGFTNPILIDEQGGIVAGHGRVMAAQSLGIAKVPCLRIGWLTESQKRAYVIADNQLAMQAGWDEDVLKSELAALQMDGFALDLLGFDDEDIDGLLAASNPETPAKNPDECPPVEQQTITKLGDVWVLGGHRVMCADCTDMAAMKVLMEGKQADVCWTDPPYNIAYEDKADGKSERNTSLILNDDMDDASFARFLADVYRSVYQLLKMGGGIYVAHAETERANFTREYLSAGFKLSGCLIWKKNTLVLGRSDYQWIHEPILYGWKPGASHRWFGGRKKTTVDKLGESSPFVLRADGRWELHFGVGVFVVDGNAEIEELLTDIIYEDKPVRNGVHPTMKPIALIERMLRNSARSGEIVLDPFGGSGSTLMAAEKLGMRARLSELSPNYVDVIVRRWQEYTGQFAVHALTGKRFN